MPTTVAVAKADTRAHEREVTSNFPNLQSVQKAMLAKLEESTLTASDAKRLQLQPMTAQQVSQLNGTLTFHRAGFKIPYFTAAGKTNHFYRFRYLEYDNARGFAKLVHADGKPQKHDPRYVQPRDTVPQLYLSPMFDWASVRERTDLPLLVTEGELKAACACKHGLPTIGLGGVWSFRSAAQNLPLLPAFAWFKLDKRTVFVCFDSDAAINPDVAMAEQALARELTKMGAVVMICRLPAVGEKKTGLDDYIRQQGADQFKASILANAVAYAPSAALFQLNEEVLYVQDPGLVLRLDTRQRMRVRDFVDHAYANRTFMREVDGKLKEFATAREWVKWPMRSTAQRMQFAPGGPQYADGVLNLWEGWGLQPWPQRVTEQDIAPWVEFRDALLGGLTPAHVAWAVAWFAYHLQHPDVKQLQAILIWSRVQGNGKNWFGETLFPIYNSAQAEQRGQPYAETLAEDTIIKDTRNTWAEGKLLVVVDDLTYRAQESYERLKPIITRTKVKVDPKYIPPFTINDFCSLYITTNRSDSLRIEDTDRRLFIHEATNPPLTGEQVHAYEHFLKHEDGYAKLFRYLLDYDCAAAGYDPKSYAPHTTAKMRLLTESASNVMAWARRVRDDPDTALRLGDVALPYKLWRGEELVAVYRAAYSDSREPDSVVYQALRSAGFRRVLERDDDKHRKDEGRVRVGSPWGKPHLWMMRDSEALAAMGEALLREQFLAERRSLVGGRKFEPPMPAVRQIKY